MKIGKLIKTYRQKCEISQRQMCKEIGVSHSTLSRIEAGKEFSAEALLKIMNWLVRQ